MSVAAQMQATEMSSAAAAVPKAEAARTQSVLKKKRGPGSRLAVLSSLLLASGIGMGWGFCLLVSRLSIPTVKMVTHALPGTGSEFWSLWERGARAACRNLNVNLDWHASAYDSTAHAGHIDAACAAPGKC